MSHLPLRFGPPLFAQVQRLRPVFALAFTVFTQGDLGMWLEQVTMQQQLHRSWSIDRSNAMYWYTNPSSS